MPVYFVWVHDFKQRNSDPNQTTGYWETGNHSMSQLKINEFTNCGFYIKVRDCRFQNSSEFANSCAIKLLQQSRRIGYSAGLQFCKIAVNLLTPVLLSYCGNRGELAILR